MKRSRLLALSAGLLLALVAIRTAYVGEQVSGDFAAGPLKQVSSRTPFSTTAFPDNLTFEQPGDAYLDSEVEPWVVVDPNNSDHIVGAWQQDRYPAAGSRGIVAGVTFDGGQNWELVTIPKLSFASGGLLNISDPWLSFASNGDLYLSSINVSLSGNTVFASKSIDGGRTWSDPKTIGSGLIIGANPDKESILADPYDPKIVYATWTFCRNPNTKV